MPRTRQGEAHEGDDHRTDQLFRLAIEAAPTGMIMVDQHGHIVLVNAQAEKLFGYGREELVGQPVELLVPVRYRAGHPRFRAQFFASPQARPMGAGRDLYGLRKDGSEVPIEIGLNPLDTADGSFVLSSIVDITERKRAAEQIEASLREKETLLREVHHRVKNNLQVISSLFNLQSRYVGDTGLSALLRESQHRVHAIALVHEALHQTQDLGCIDLHKYLDGLARHLASSWSATRPGVAVIVACDALRLPLDKAVPCGLIVNELVTNAFKHAFAEREAGDIHVQAEQQGKLVCLAVRDDGRGLPDHVDVHKLQSLGLSLVGTLTRQLGGQLEVTRGGGTVIRITFGTEA